VPTPRPTEPGDLPALSELYAEGFGRPWSLAEWEWKYRRLPGEARSFVVEDAEGRLCAHVGALALPARWRGGEGLLWQLTDFVGRGAGLHPPLVRAGRRLLADLPRDADLPWIFGFPSYRHLALGERVFGYRPLAPAEWWQAALPPAGGGTVAPLLTGDSPGPGAEAAWEACGGLGVRRTAAFLSWRYTARPERYYRFYAPVSSGSRADASLSAFAVAAFAGPVATLAELWLPRGTDGEGFLRAVAADLRELGLERWRAWPAPGQEGLLGGLGLRPSGELVPRGCRGREGGGEATAALAASLYHPPGDYDLV
jgi:hypothetical protein